MILCTIHIKSYKIIYDQMQILLWAYCLVIRPGYTKVEKSEIRSYDLHTRSCSVDEIFQESDKNSSFPRSCTRSYYIFFEWSYIHFIYTNNL